MKEQEFNNYVEQNQDLHGDYPNVVESNKIMMQRQENNRYMLYKIPIDECIKQKYLEIESINNQKNLSKILDSKLSEFVNLLKQEKDEEFKNLFDK